MTDVFGWRMEAATLPAPPRKEPTMALYWLRLFDGAYEVLRKTKVVIDVDLDQPATNVILNQQFVALVNLARTAENEPMDTPIMRVYDAAGGAPVRDWVA